MRFTAKFKDGSTAGLYGSDFFADKAVFWRAHQSNLIAFSLMVCQKGRPVELLDKKTGEALSFQNTDEFDQWFSEHQSSKLDFGFSDLTETGSILTECRFRLQEMKAFLKADIQKLQASPPKSWPEMEGRYDFVRKTSELCICSINRIQSRHPELKDHAELENMKNLFSIPSKEMLQGESLLSNGKKETSELDPQILLKLSEMSLSHINQLENQLR